MGTRSTNDTVQEGAALEWPSPNAIRMTVACRVQAIEKTRAEWETVSQRARWSGQKSRGVQCVWAMLVNVSVTFWVDEIVRRTFLGLSWHLLRCNGGPILYRDWYPLYPTLEMRWAAMNRAKIELGSYLDHLSGEWSIHSLVCKFMCRLFSFHLNPLFAGAGRTVP